MPTPARRSERELSKGDRREEALIRAGERLLADGSFERASVADLAAEAGLSRASFYFYFASKQALLSAVIAAAVADLETRLAGDLPDGPPSSPAELVRMTVRAATDLWWDHRVVLVASVELGTQLPEVYERNLESINRVARVTLALLHDAGFATGGSGRGGEVEVTERLVTTLVLMTERNFYDLARSSRRREDYDDLAVLLTAIWLRTLGLAD